MCLLACHCEAGTACFLSFYVLTSWIALVTMLCVVTMNVASGVFNLECENSFSLSPPGIYYRLIIKQRCDESPHSKKGFFFHTHFMNGLYSWKYLNVSFYPFMYFLRGRLLFKVYDSVKSRFVPCTKRRSLCMLFLCFSTRPKKLNPRPSWPPGFPISVENDDKRPPVVLCLSTNMFR